MKLVYENSGAEVKVGDEVTTFHGEKCRVHSIEAPRHSGSTGRVYVTSLAWGGEPNEPDGTQSFYPNVIGAKWVERDDQVADDRARFIPYTAVEVTDDFVERECFRAECAAERAMDDAADASAPQEEETAGEVAKRLGALVVPIQNRRVFEALAERIGAMFNHPKPEWLAQWRDEADDITKEHLPSGSGFDTGTKIVWERTNAKRIVFSTAFHHMDEHGSYDGWSEHEVIITPAFVGGFDIRVTGRDRNGIKDYIGETFYIALNEVIAA